MKRRGKYSTNLGLMFAALVMSWGPGWRVLAGDEAATDSPRQWAVIVAIEDYAATSMPDLKGSLLDARDLKQTLIERVGVSPGDILELNDQSKADFRPTKSHLKEHLTQFLKKPQRGDSLLVFWSGYQTERDGNAYLLPSDGVLNDPATWLRVETLAKYLGISKADVKLVILDAVLLGKSKEEPTSAKLPQKTSSEPATDSLIDRQFREKDHVVIASGNASASHRQWPEKQRGIFAYWLCRGLEGAADKDGDGQIHSQELFDFLCDRVELTVRQLQFSPQTPCRQMGVEVEGDPVVLAVRPDSPSHVCQRIAALLDQEMRLRGMKTVALGQEFRVKTLGGARRLASFPFPKQLAGEVRSELMRLSLVDKKYSVKPEEALVVSEDGNPPGGAAPPVLENHSQAMVLGEIQLLPRGIGVQCELRAGKEAPVASSGLIRLDEDRFADLGQSINVIAAPTSDDPVERDAFVLKQSKEAHPLRDPNFPFQLTIHRFLQLDPTSKTPVFEETPEQPIASPRAVWDGTSIDPDPRTLVIPAEPDERFMVRLENRTDQRVAARLFVDGINTLGKHPEWNGQGAGWIIEPKSHIDVKGWYAIKNGAEGKNNAKVEAESSWFVFTDIAKSVAQRLNSTEKIGLITAVFYAEETSRAIGVGEIKAGTVSLEYKPFRWGRMLASLQLGYADERELRQSTEP